MNLDSLSGSCTCPPLSYFDPSRGSCLDLSETVTNKSSNAINYRQKLKFRGQKSQQLRNLQVQDPSTLTQITTQQVLTSSLDFQNTFFVKTDATFDTDYMIKVGSFVQGMTVRFTNSVIDVRGNFFHSLYPVTLVFDNCTFLVANTTNLFNLDYSAGGVYGCTDGESMTQGDFEIKNSFFMDSISGAKTPTATSRSLFNVKSLYDIKFNTVTFTKMGMKHSALFQDFLCQSRPLEIQTIQLNKLTVSQSNINFMFKLDSFSNSSIKAQTNFSLTGSTLSQITLQSQSWLTLSLKRININTQYVDVSSITASQIVVDSVPFINLGLCSFAAVTMSNVILNTGTMTDFIRLDTAESLQMTGVNRFDSVDGSIAGASLDTSKSGLLSVSTVKTVSLDGLTIQSSTLTVSPSIMMDSVSIINIKNTIIQSVRVQTSDLIVIKKPIMVMLSTCTIQNIMNNMLNVTKYVISMSNLQLLQDQSTFTIDKPTFKNSTVALINVKGYSMINSNDVSKYNIALQNCGVFSNNLFTGYNLVSFIDLPTTTFDFVNSFCFTDASKASSCTGATYFDTILMQCASCPTGCSACESENKCTSCTITDLSVNPLTGLCQCSSQKYYYDKDNKPRCRKCLDKCATCNNEYQCLSYAKCLNPLQVVNPTSGQCEYQCSSGFLTSTGCSNCTLANCELCDKSPTGQERCGLCANNYYLDLKTYTCVQECPASSKAIASANTYSKGKTSTVRYCRPYVNNTAFAYDYYVNPNSTSYLELGTIEYPFKNMDSPAKEIFNFMYERDTMFTVYHMRGTSMKHYYGIMPLIIVNVKMYNLFTYGDPAHKKPYVYVTGHDYLWPDSTLFSLAESYYDLNTRVNRGDMDISESKKFFLKFSVFRSSIYIRGLDFQSIMFGDAWSNPLIFSFDAPNQTVVMEDTYLDLDGALYEAYFPISLRIKNAHFNFTNFQYGVWNDFRWDCYANNATDVGGYLIVEDSLFSGYHQQALYNFFFFSSFDDFIIRNSTFDNCTYLDMETRPFVDVHPQSMCDPDFRTQRVFLDNNKFINLDSASLMFVINYMSDFNGTKIFSMQNNFFQDTIINTQLISIQIQNQAQVRVANNYYKNVTVLKDKKVFYFFSEPSNITINNETLINNVLDDLYTIGAANNVMIEDFNVTGINNTGAITETSAILRVSTASNLCSIKRFSVNKCNFKYGKAIEIEQAKTLVFSDAIYYQNSLQNQDFFVFNQIVRANISNLRFDQFSKISDKSRFAISMPTLTLASGVSAYEIKNISFTNSHASFFSVSQVQMQSSMATSTVTSTRDLNVAPFLFTMSNCTVQDNYLSSKDSLIEFGEINYQNFAVRLASVHIINNVLELGTIYQLKMNCKELSIMNSQILRNQGQFALLEPASSDEANPLNFSLDNTTFTQNYARADALIQLTTNSKLRATNSNFTENYSVGRGSVVFADYQSVYAYFNNCSFVRNYAYQGGVFYVQYSSQVEVSACTITENFGVTGGVAYVNNDGQIKINNGTRVFKNSALNTCFLFLINTQFESMLDNIVITQNDQSNSLISKDRFLNISTSYLHMKSEFFSKLSQIADKIQRTINEKADSAVYAIKAKVNISNTDIYQNDIFLSASTESTVGMKNTTIRDLVASGKVFQAVSSVIEMDSVNMLRITYTLNSGITSSPTDIMQNFYKVTIVNKSILRAFNCNFSLIDGLFLYVSGSVLSLEGGSTVKQLTNDDDGQPLVSIDTSQVNIIDTEFTKLKSLKVSPIFNLQETNMLSQKVSFTEFDKTLFSMEGGSYTFDKLNISKGQMAWLVEIDAFMVNSVVFDVSAADLTLNNTNVTGIFTNYSSPVVYIENDPSASQQHDLILYKSHFVGNTANESAGVILSVNTNVTIEDCLFENNTALIKDAGALYLDCQDSSTLPCKYTIKDSRFKNNSAKMDGGAIKYTYYAPMQVNNTYLNNAATYGSNIASYPVQMRIGESTVGRVLEMLNATEIKALNLSANSIVYQLEQPLVSGSLLTQNLTLELLDEQNRNLTTDNSSIALMSTTSPQVTVMKSKSVKANKGRFTFDDVIVVGPPGTDILLKITTESINKEKISRAYPQLEGQLPDIYIKGRLRLCQAGEYQTTDFKCIMCSDGFFTLTENQQQCSECPENAVCQDGFNIIVDKGHWRANVSTTAIFQCYNADACEGGYESDCKDGYGGNLCHSCVNYEGTWYSRESNNNCAECLSYSINSWRLFGVIVLVVLYFVVLIYVNIQATQQGQQRLSTVYMRILTNYFQILTLASSYDLSWSDNMKTFLQYISIVAKGSEILFSVDCFLRDNGVMTEPIYFKMILACLFPLMCIVIVSIFWFVYNKYRRDPQAFTKFITSVIIVIFMTLPTVTTITFAIYNCIDVFNDGNTYLAVDMSLQCWSGDHDYYSNRFGIPIIVIWILGLPGLALFALYLKREQLSDDENLARYGFLYTGLNHSAFYWEILLHFRKVIMICINVFLTTFKPLYRALIGFMLMIVYIEVLQKVQPYQTQEINTLEFKANMAAFATFYGGLFFISSDLPFAVTVLLFLAILAINLYFWYSWINMMFATRVQRFKLWFNRTCFRNTFAIIEPGQIPEEQQQQHHLIDNAQGPDSSFLKNQNDESILEAYAVNEQDLHNPRYSHNKNDKQHSKNGKKGKNDNTRLLDDSAMQDLGVSNEMSRFHNDDEFEEEEHQEQLMMREQQKNHQDRSKKHHSSKGHANHQRDKIKRIDEESGDEGKGSSMINPIYESSLKIDQKSKQQQPPTKSNQAKQRTPEKFVESHKPRVTEQRNNKEQLDSLGDGSISLASLGNYSSDSEDQKFKQAIDKKKEKQKSKSKEKESSQPTKNGRGSTATQPKTNTHGSSEVNSSEGITPVTMNTTVTKAIAGKERDQSQKRNAGEIIDKSSTNKDNSSGGNNHGVGNESSLGEMKVSQESEPRIPIVDDNSKAEKNQRKRNKSQEKEEKMRERSREHSNNQRSKAQTEDKIKSKSRQRSESSDESLSGRKPAPNVTKVNQERPLSQKQPQHRDSEISGTSLDRQQNNVVENISKQIEQATKKAASKSKERKHNQKDDYEISNSEIEQPKVHNGKYQKQMEKKGRNAPDKPKPQAPQIDLSQQQTTFNPDNQGANPMNMTMKEREKLFQKNHNPMDRTVQNFARKKEPKVVPAVIDHRNKIEERSENSNERDRSHHKDRSHKQGRSQHRSSNQREQRDHSNEHRKRQDGAGRREQVDDHIGHQKHSKSKQQRDPRMIEDGDYYDHKKHQNPIQIKNQLISDDSDNADFESSELETQNRKKPTNQRVNQRDQSLEKRQRGHQNERDSGSRPHHRDYAINDAKNQRNKGDQRNPKRRNRSPSESSY